MVVRTITGALGCFAPCTCRSLIVGATCCPEDQGATINTAIPAATTAAAMTAITLWVVWVRIVVIEVMAPVIRYPDRSGVLRQ